MGKGSRTKAKTKPAQRPAILPPLREPNGRHARAGAPTRAQLEFLDKQAKEAERAKVQGHAWDQPGRAGANDPKSRILENPWGRFCDAHRVRDEIYRAGDTLTMLIRTWRLAKNLPCPFGKNGDAIGHDPDDVDVAKLRARVDAAEAAMRRASRKGARGMVMMCGARQETTDHPAAVIRAARALAVHFGLITQATHPFGS